MANKNSTSNPYAYNQMGQVGDPYINQISRDPYANRQYMPPGSHTHSVVNGPLQASPVVPATPKEHQYSLAEVQLVSGGMIGMTINASTKIADHLLKGMKETGFLHLRNEAESIVLRAEDVRAFKLTQLTTEG